jgi:hypothetical protein
MESYVTFGTGNCILGAVFVIAVKQYRAALPDVWMTRTYSA